MNIIPTRARAIIMCRLTPEERKEIRDSVKSKRYLWGLIRPLLTVMIICVAATVWQYYCVWDVAIRDIKVEDHIWALVLVSFAFLMVPATIYSVFAEE